MAMHHFKFEPDGADPEAFFRALAPRQIVSAVNQVINFLSMPVAKRDPDSVAGEVEAILVAELGWLERVVKDAADTAVEAVAQKLDDGLDMADVAASADFTAGARLNMRNALYFCWSALPDARRTPAEAERIVRIAISRQFGLTEEIRRTLVEGR